MDEVSIVGETRVVEVTPDGIRSYTVVPEQVGLSRADPDELAGGTAERCVEIVHEIFEGAGGPRRSLAVMNAGAALHVAGKASDLEEGVRLAEQAIDSGAAREALARFVARTVELAPEVEAQSR
jgi:anthranilate phosphoribosyltransferase